MAFSTLSRPGEKHDPEFKPVGIAYLRIAPDGTIELRIRYQAEMKDAVKSDIAATFGVGALDWNQK